MKNNIIIQGDAIEEMKKLELNSVDAIITDPPYGIGFMGKEWDRFEPERIKKDTEYYNKRKVVKPEVRKSRLSMISSAAAQAGSYDTSIIGARGFQKFCEDWSKEAIRVLKPGGFMLVSCSTRMYHRMTCGIEDAGFEIRDTIMWLYGSGFPKSLNIGQDFDRQECRKQLTKKLGRKPTRDEFKKQWETFRKVVGEIKRGDVQKAKEKGVGYLSDPANRNNEKQFGYGVEKITIPQTLEAKEWEGWGTALKPACEPIVVARKPLSEKNVALNVLKWGTGGINIDTCRIGYNMTDKDPATNPLYRKQAGYKNKQYCDDGSSSYKLRDEKESERIINEQGRFPANIILDEEAGKMLDEQSGNLKPQGNKLGKSIDTKGKGSFFGGGQVNDLNNYKDSGGASRFFYCAKASKSERNFGCEEMEQKDMRKEDGSAKSMEIFSNQYTESSGNPTGRGITSKRANNHPTVKPIKLMEYLIKLVTRKGARVLDPFVGSGTTMIACIKLGRIPMGIEKEEEYVKIANARIKPFLEQEKL